MFKAIDVVVYFNVIIFFASGVTAMNAGANLATVFFVLTVVNILYIVSIIRLRLKYNERFLERIKLESKIENTIDEAAKVEYKLHKQDILERRIEAEILEKMPDAKVIRNAYVPKSDGNYLEIDLVVICTKGIFIIESKNLVGVVKGSWKDDVLRIYHPGGKDYPLPNPIHQNTAHYQYLKSILGLKGDLFRSIVVFSDLVHIDNYRDIPSYARVCKLDQLIDAMTKLSKTHNTSMEEHLVNTTYETLLPIVEKTDEKKMKHIERIKSLGNK